jgi:hypothetical protein
MAVHGAFDVDQSTDTTFIIDMGNTGLTPGNITLKKWRPGDTAWQNVDAGTAVTHELSNNLYRGTLDKNDVDTLGALVIKGNTAGDAEVGFTNFNVKEVDSTPSGKPASSPIVPQGS